MTSQEALEIIRAVSPARLKAAMALESDPSKDWSEIPAADRDIITAASWDDTCRKIAAEKAAERQMTPANTKICGKTFTRATGAGETLHWFRPVEITESVVEDHGYGNRSYHGERGTGKFRVFIGDMGGRAYSGPLTEALIVAATAAAFPELAGKLVGVSSRA